MKRLTILLSLFLLLIFSAYATYNSSFEGKISFIRETVFDTTYLTISVKGNMARADEFDQQMNLLSTKLIDLNEESVTALSHERRQYTNITVYPRRTNALNSLEIKKTGNHKEINGITCYQWRVKDIQRNTEIAYWVAQERFDFFERLLHLLNRTEHSLRVYGSIPGNEGFFPFLTEERTLLRKDKLRISVVEIDERNLSQTLFQVPQGYKPVSGT